MDVYSAFQSVAALFGLWLAIYYLWRDFRFDSFREDIFAVRDEMFLYAAEGNIEFSDPAYSILRTRMNALLRHGHDLTIRRAVLLLFTHSGINSSDTMQWEEAVDKLPAEMKARMRQYNARMMIFVLQHMVYCSFFRYLVLRPFMTSNKVHQLIDTPVVASGVQRLESETTEEDKRIMSEVVVA